MSEITFDQHGHLMPYEIIDLDLEGLKWHFVTAFEKSLIREALYRQLMLLIEKLRVEIVGSFFILVDGSFVSTKENPADIDLVVFMPVDEFDHQTSMIQHIVYQKAQLRRRGLHMFTAYFCPEGHPRFEEAKADFDEWVYWFSNSKSENGVALPKGIVRLNFNSQQS